MLDRCLKSVHFRWLDYDPVGKDMPGTRFVAFKTPLHSSYFLNRGVTFDDEDVFETKTLLEMVLTLHLFIFLHFCSDNSSEADRQGKKVGLVIDLTATDRYYDPLEWTSSGVKYVKIRCTGHEVYAEPGNIEKFRNVVTKFLLENSDNGEPFLAYL
ncbi:unnamed protein product, partial [Gongylonema pulchrum]|uniref:Abhydrolase_4 domain-containing protein n=1 Tax=Gongylonema pulchrum TaxID=637853 RepID=A0A183ED71_9BILA